MLLMLTMMEKLLLLPLMMTMMMDMGVHARFTWGTRRQ
jgi:hypothetical protein